MLKNVKRILSLGLSAALLCAPLYSFAAGGSFQVVPDGMYHVHINGMAAPKTLVSLQILYLNQLTNSPQLTAENIGELLYYSDSEKTGISGSYSFEVNLGNASGNYAIRVNTLSGNEKGEYIFRYYSPVYALEVLERLNTAITEKNGAAVARIIQEDTNALAPNSDYYQKTVEQQIFPDVCQILIKFGVAADKSDFQKKFMQAVLLAYFESTTDADTLKTVLNDCAVTIGIAESPYYRDVFLKKLSATIQGSVLSGIQSLSPYENMMEFTEDLSKLTVFKGIAGSDWTTVQSILEETGVEIDPETAQDYQSLKSDYPNYYPNVAKALVGRTFSDWDTFIIAWDDAINDAIAAAQNASKNTGSGGSGGGGKNAGVSAVFPVTSPDNTMTENTPDQSEPDGWFDDLSGVAWAREGVSVLASRGILRGKAERLFYPNDTITREELLTLLVRAKNIVDETAVCDFSDVPEDAWFYSSVASAYQAGIVQGIGGGLFGTGTPITREDLCVLAYNAIAPVLGEQNSQLKDMSFSDLKEINPYALQAVTALYHLGVIEGQADGSFSPSGQATRAEAATIIYRLIGLGDGK